MIRSQPKSLGQRVDRAGRRSIAALSVAVALALASPTAAEEYDPSNAGHPVRMVAYLLHPVGVAIDYLIMRPAHWIGSFEPMKTLFGQED